MRTSRPSARSPDANVTVTVTVRSAGLAGRTAASSPSTATAATGDPGILQHLRIGDSRRDALQVSGRRMTAGAFRLEVGLAFARIAYQDTRRRLADRWRHALSADSLHHTPDICGHCRRIRRTHIDGRHSGILTAALNDRDDRLAVAVAQGNLRSQQVGSANVAASQVRAVTAGATDAVQRLPARDLRRVARRPLLSGNEPSAAPSALCGRRWPLRREHRHGKCQSEQSCACLDPHPSPHRNLRIVRLFRALAHQLAARL